MTHFYALRLFDSSGKLIKVSKNFQTPASIYFYARQDQLVDYARRAAALVCARIGKPIEYVDDVQLVDLGPKEDRMSKYART